ncbi:hypothetical protein SBF1_3730003 [Candidatus Desulfosporosinus infrequens]|uniref:Uncharacterized protein n=1 Tax=Candidatus Desulfosporosinus infrequens TaxID=2043169 RepID=A0A2U3L4U7_9FIRM|nr:hypothetical protein SBF1_3730003 [Candidatus Desulfosporosinus infrequens]
MGTRLKTCPHSPAHRVYGGYPEYVCSECATEWVVAKAKGSRGHFNVLYTHFNSEGKILSHWKKPLADDVLVSTNRRSLAI